MSKKNRFYEAVKQGLEKSSYLVEERICNYVTVGEVAKAGEVSRGTARKYLDIMAETPYVSSLNVNGHMFYRIRIVDAD